MGVPWRARGPCLWGCWAQRTARAGQRGCGQESRQLSAAALHRSSSCAGGSERHGGGRALPFCFAAGTWIEVLNSKLKLERELRKKDSKMFQVLEIFDSVSNISSWQKNLLSRKSFTVVPRNAASMEHFHKLSSVMQQQLHKSEMISSGTAVKCYSNNTSLTFE